MAVIADGPSLARPSPPAASLEHEVVIVGGGTAGLTVASRLARDGRGLDIAVIEPSTVHYYQPLWTLVGGGIGTVAGTARPEADLMPEGVTWSRPQGGMFVWVKLPAGMDGAKLLERALAEERVAFVPGAPFFAVDPKPNTLRLSYSLPSPEQIEEGVSRLARVLAGARSQHSLARAG